MSTKIYNGVIFSQSDFFTLFEDLQKWREHMEEIILEYKTSWIINNAVNKIDSAILKNEDIKNPYGDSLWELFEREREIKKTGYRDHQIDTDFNICIIPDMENRQFYGIIYTERNEWKKKFLELDYVEEFGYWDSTDNPDNISFEEWERRGETWERLIPSGIPSEAGFSIECLCHKFPFLDGFEKHLPTKTERAKLNAVNSVRNEWFKPFYEENDRNDKEFVYKISRLLFKFDAWSKTEEGIKRIEERTLEIKSILPDITRDILVNGFKPLENDIKAIAGETCNV